MRANGDDGSFSLQVFDSWDGGTDTCIVGNFLAVKRNVDITSDQDLLSLKLSFSEVFDGLLSLKFCGRSGSEGV